MTDAKRFLDDTRIASPCKADWDQMTGSDTVRYCSECKLNVYNISNMVASDAAALISRADGGICVRLYRRKDGTVLTQDCPVGLRAAIRRTTRAAGAALTAVLGLFSGVAARTAWAQSCSSGGGETTPVTMEQGDVAQEPEEPPVLMGKIAIARIENVSVVVEDESGAPIATADVVLTDLGTGEVLEALTDGDGIYRFEDVAVGVYTLSATAPGYANPLPRTIRVRNAKKIETRLVLAEKPEMLMGGVVPQRPNR